MTAFREPINLYDLLAELVWASAGLASLIPVERALDSQAELNSFAQLADDARHLEAAHTKGRAFVVDLVRQASDALDRVAGSTPDLDPRFAAEVDRRLAGIDRRLQELGCARAV